MLDDKSPVPLYYQLQEIIRGRIEKGEWQPGQQLPPEADLCQEFNLSRGTVRQALSDLVREGLLNRRRGKGSFVAAPKLSQDIVGIAASFAEYAKKATGVELGNRLLGVRVMPATGSLASSLGLAEGTEVIEVSKVKLNGDRPYFVATSYLPRADYPGLENADHSTGSLYEYVRDNYHLRVARVEGWFEPVILNEHDASILGVDKGSPAMAYECIRYSAEGRPQTITKHIIRGDMCRLTFQVDNTSSPFMEK